MRLSELVLVLLWLPSVLHKCTHRHAPGISRSRAPSPAPSFYPRRGTNCVSPVDCFTAHLQHRLSSDPTPHPQPPLVQQTCRCWRLAHSHFETARCPLHRKPDQSKIDPEPEVAPTATTFYRTLGIGHFPPPLLQVWNKNTRNLGDLIDGMESGQGTKVPVTYFVGRRITGAWRVERAEEPLASFAQGTWRLWKERVQRLLPGTYPRKKAAAGDRSRVWA